MDEKLEIIMNVCEDEDIDDGKIEAIVEIYGYVNSKNIKNVPENTLNGKIFDKLENNISLEVDEEDL